MSEVSKFSPDEGMTIYDIKDKNGRIMSEKLIRNTVGWTGKNRLKYDLASLKAGNTGGTWNGNNYTIAGVTYTVNSDNSLSAANSASSSSEVVLYYGDNYLENGKEYRITNGVAKNAGYFLAINGHASDGTWKKVLAWTTVDGNEVFTNDTSEYPKIRVVLHINSGVNPNTTFKPMICDSAITDTTYEPYHDTVSDEITDVYKVMGEIGAQNVWKNNLTFVKKSAGGNYTYLDGVFTVTTAAQDYSGIYFDSALMQAYYNKSLTGKYILSFYAKGDTQFNAWLGTLSANVQLTTEFTKYTYIIDDITQITNVRLYSRYGQNTHTITAKNFMLMPYLFQSTDYASPSMSNKEIYNYLLGTEGSVSFNSGYSIWTINKLKTMGNLCFMNVSVSGEFPANTEVNVGTIPEGFRPGQTLYIPSGTNKAFTYCKLTNNGDMLIKSSVADNSVCVTAVYFIP